MRILNKLLNQLKLTGGFQRAFILIYFTTLICYMQAASLSPDEIKEIQKTWAIPAAIPKEAGKKILLTFFTDHLPYMQKFPAFKDKKVGELEKNPQFEAHALRVVKVFDDSIKLLGKSGSDKKLVEIWTRIAKSHFPREIPKEAFNDLKATILKVLTEVCKLNDKQKVAWGKLMDTVYKIIFDTLDKLKRGDL